jgi:hypothetical protein
MQDIKEEFSKDIESLKINQIEILKMKISPRQIKTQLKGQPTDLIKFKRDNQSLMKS